ncbi:XTP/dITP diphosphatase [Selenihalanaerobacter shriftii]|uniref:dITP/XTP pyrophosphatase n=1 Tax=Selenihalanaerobacter shriftii TaxID=142842 RepID=A0A1T4MN56_9FIRM|nr:XTP/dITP diphosphatase [Selenihalanaerobacter shriftii]SJZ68442.1 XTP/dITP diphosphohydrolase [Selenihalanaerobacter shriftii]
MTKIFLATGNQGKIKEMKELLSNLDIEIVTSDQFEDVPEVIEDGDTLADNAIKKAKELAEYTGLIAIADDTGLIVDALDGKPGVYSARYAGENATDEENNKKLLHELADLSLEERTARFKTVVALANPGQEEESIAFKTIQGVCEGQIGYKPLGENGFGYDPLFIPKGYDRTFAQLNSEVKNQISHRAKALIKMKKYLKRL